MCPESLHRVQAHSGSHKQTRTHAGTASCRPRNTHTQPLPAAYKAHALRNRPLGLHIRRIECFTVGFDILLYMRKKRKKAQSVILVQPLYRRRESTSCYRFNRVTDSFVSSRCHSMSGMPVENRMGNLVSQFCYQAVILLV